MKVISKNFRQNEILPLLAWIDSGSSFADEINREIYRMKYAIGVFEKSLVNHYGQATNPYITSEMYGKTWGELILFGKSISGTAETDLKLIQNVVGCLFEEIYNHKAHPVLLIADEVNAIYEKKMEDISPYTRCAKISGIEFANGYKLLSGTGITAIFYIV